MREYLLREIHEALSQHITNVKIVRSKVSDYSVYYPGANHFIDGLTSQLSGVKWSVDGDYINISLSPQSVLERFTSPNWTTSLPPPTHPSSLMDIYSRLCGVERLKYSTPLTDADKSILLRLIELDTTRSSLWHTAIDQLCIDLHRWLSQSQPRLEVVQAVRKVLESVLRIMNITHTV